MDCLFCKIAAGEIPSSKVYEDDYVYAFRDINPQAKVHVLIIPKKHVMSSMEDFDIETNGGILLHVFDAVKKIARQEGLVNGYRIINNCGEDGAQSVKHLHFHLLGGEKLPEKIC